MIATMTSRIVRRFAATIVAVLTAVGATSCAGSQERSPSAEGYRYLGQYQGVRLWVHTYPHNEIALRTTGDRGGLCNSTDRRPEEGETQLCADTANGQSFYVYLASAGVHAMTLTFKDGNEDYVDESIDGGQVLPGYVLFVCEHDGDVGVTEAQFQ